MVSRGQKQVPERNEMPIKLINPMSETPVKVSARLASLHGKTVGLLEISKPGSGLFLDRLDRLLRDRYHVASIVRTMKPTFARPVPPGISNSYERSTPLSSR
jgi:hypothetical protein